MPRFWVSIYHPDNYDSSIEDEVTHHALDELNVDHDSAVEPKSISQAIDDLNDEMVSAGVRAFVGGLYPPTEAKSIRLQNGEAVVFDGPYLKTAEHVGGFWVLECASLEEAVEWGRKAAVACRTPVEVRPFH